MNNRAELSGLHRVPRQERRLADREIRPQVQVRVDAQLCRVSRIIEDPYGRRIGF